MMLDGSASGDGGQPGPGSGTLGSVLSAVVLIALVSAVALLSRRYGATGPVRTCCSNARWPPDDLTDPQRQPPAGIDGASPPRSAPSHHS